MNGTEELCHVSDKDNSELSKFTVRISSSENTRVPKKLGRETDDCVYSNFCEMYLPIRSRTKTKKKIINK